MTTSTNVETGAGASSRPAPADRLRTAAVAASTAAMILIPTLGQLVAGTEEGAEEFDTEITPPRYAFAIWAPIFLTSAAHGIQAAVDPTATINRRTGWWITGSYGATALWSVAAQSGRFRYTPFILPVAAGLAAAAYREAQLVQPHGAQRLAAHSTGMFLGWTSVASVVNAFATRRQDRFAPTTRAGRSAARGAVAAAAAVVSAGIAASRHGYTGLALTSGWALATSAANPERTVRTRQINAAGAALIAAVTAFRLWTTRRDPAGRAVRRRRGSPCPG